VAKKKLAVKPSIRVPNVSITARTGRRGPKPKLIADEETLQRVKELAALQLTQEEAAAVLLVSRKTFNQFLSKTPSAREMWEMGTDSGRVSVKRAQFVMAHHSVTAAIWWGKQHLGQSDKVEETVNAQHEHTHTIIQDAAAEFDAGVDQLFDRLRGEGVGNEPTAGRTKTTH
jgi:hypothetical protein